MANCKIIMKVCDEQKASHVFRHITRRAVFPQTVWLTLRVPTVVEKGGVLDRRWQMGLRGNSRTFVLRCAFFVVIFVFSGWPRWTGTAFSW